MVLVAALLVLAAVGLLLAGLDQGSAALQWGSFAASGLAAVLLLVTELRGRRRARQEAAHPTGSTAGAARTGDVPAPVSAEEPNPAGDDVEVRRALPPPVPPSSPAIPQVSGPTSGATSRLGDLARPTGDGGPRGQQPATTPPGRGRSGGAHSATDLPRVSAGGGAPADGAAPSPALGADGEPVAEEVEVTDLLLVLDLDDEVLVVDEHPRYHLPGCPHLSGAETIPVAMVEARTDGFTPCGVCTPDRVLARRERARRSG